MHACRLSLHFLSVFGKVWTVYLEVINSYFQTDTLFFVCLSLPVHLLGVGGHPSNGTCTHPGEDLAHLVYVVVFCCFQLDTSQRTLEFEHSPVALS